MLSLERFSAASLLSLPALAGGETVAGAPTTQQQQQALPPAGYHLHGVLVHKGSMVWEGHYYAVGQQVRLSLANALHLC
jgi:hypothetical protein